MGPISMLRDGGVAIWPILLVGLIALGIAAERAYHVVFRANVNAPAFMAQVQKLVMANSLDTAIKVCNAEPHAALPYVVKAGLARANRSEKEIADAIDEAVREVTPPLERRTPWLPALATVATLLGLLGTIGGLVQAFEALALAAPEVRQRVLGEGVAHAMYASAAGLYVAIPAVAAYAFIVQQTNRILDDVDQHALKIANLLAARRRGLGDVPSDPDTEGETEEKEPVAARK